MDASPERGDDQGHQDDEELLFRQRVKARVERLRVNDVASQIYAAEKAAEIAGETADLDIGELLDSDDPDVVWLVEPVIAADGGYTGLVADGKAGKSLLALEIACALATGHPVLGNPPREPVTVGYLDYENPRGEIRRRIRALGYDAPSLRGLLIKNLRYASMPSFGPLDTETGAANLLKWVDQNVPALLIIDTVSRVISTDKEDSSTPWLAFYRLTVAPLRARKVSTMRLDHFGKDRERGGRGSSAKTQDVDHIWELRVTNGSRLSMERTHSRSGIGSDRLLIRRTGNPQERGTTRHEVTSDEAILVGQEILSLAALADQLGLPPDAGKRPLKDRLQKAGRGDATERACAKVAEYRRAMAEKPVLCPGCKKVPLPPGHSTCAECRAKLDREDRATGGQDSFMDLDRLTGG
jgi:hypothetical protein